MSPCILVGHTVHGGTVALAAVAGAVESVSTTQSVTF